MTKESNLPKFTIKQLLEAGVHFGHKTMRRNTKMSKYLYGARNGLSIIDLQQTANLLHNSLKIVREVAKNNGRILFVATKKQAVDVVAEAASRCGQYYVNHRWLGGMLTNWKTVSQSIKTLRKIEDQLANDELGLNKKEKLVLERKRNKLELTLGGIKNMGGSPDLIFVIDTPREILAIAEAKRLGVPIIAILDSNSNPTGITYPIPGNDDSVKAIKLYCRLISDAILAGIRENMAIAGVDINKLEGASAAELHNAKKSIEKVAEKPRSDMKAKDAPYKKDSNHKNEVHHNKEHKAPVTDAVKSEKPLIAKQKAAPAKEDKKATAEAHKSKDSKESQDAKPKPKKPATTGATKKASTETKKPAKKK
jgi:small subunit ribosomal protein S2